MTIAVLFQGINTLFFVQLIEKKTPSPSCAEKLRYSDTVSCPQTDKFSKIKFSIRAEYSERSSLKSVNS